MVRRFKNMTEKGHGANFFLLKDRGVIASQNLLQET